VAQVAQVVGIASLFKQMKISTVAQLTFLPYSTRATFFLF